MSVPFIDLKRQHLDIASELKSDFERVFDHHQFTSGSEVKDFEKHWSSSIKVDYSVGCSSGTDALILALQAADIGEGDEVITTSHTYFATVEAIVDVGATPILVDIREDNALMDTKLLKNKITSKTKAIICVHLYGHPVDMDEVVKIAKESKILCIEDASQAHGSFYKGRPVGSLGDMSTFSFYPSKTLGALGDAGIVSTNNLNFAEKMFSLRDHGQSEKYHHKLFGSNRRMDGMQGAFLSTKLKLLPKWVEQRKVVAGIYDTAFSQVSGLRLLENVGEVINSYHLYVVCVEDRTGFMEFLKQKKIGSSIHYPIACHQQASWLEQFPENSLPHTETFVGTCVSLPMFNGITEKEAEEVVSVVKEYFGN